MSSICHSIKILADRSNLFAFMYGSYCMRRTIIYIKSIILDSDMQRVLGHVGPASFKRTFISSSDKS